MAEILTIARPYAKAAFNIAIEEKQEVQWLNFFNNLAEMWKLKTVRAHLSDPSVPVTKQVQRVQKFLIQELSDVQSRFLNYVVASGRLPAVSAMSLIFSELWLARMKRCLVNVTTAFQLSEAETKALEKIIQQQLGLETIIEVAIDSDLIGGVVIRAGDWVLDASVRGKLNRLAEVLGVSREV